MADIVVGVDGSEPSRKALRWALKESQQRGETPVKVVHAYRSPETRSPYDSSAAYLPSGTLRTLTDLDRAWRQEQETIARQRAESLIAQALDKEAPDTTGLVVKSIVVPDDPARTLVDMSRDAELLVVGSRGLGGFKGLLVGSVSQQCLHHATCPVVVVR